jgi:serine/threonine-protein kinase
VLFGVNPRTSSNPAAAFNELEDTQEHRPQRTQSRPPVAWIWVGILVTAVVIVAVVVWVVNLQPGQAPVSSSVNVPNVSGATWESGQQALKKKDLSAIKVGQNSATVPTDTIIRTDPKAGTNVARQQSIRVIVSLGPEQVTVPDVANQAQDAAVATLTAAGFKIGSTNSDYSPDAPEGSVLSTDPASGTTNNKGTVVNLVVSNGKVQLPDVTKQPFSDANSALVGLGLSVQPSPDYTCQGGTVTTQSLPPGDTPQGSTITIGYCAGTTPSPSQTPAPGDTAAPGGQDTGTNG